VRRSLLLITLLSGAFFPVASAGMWEDCATTGANTGAITPWPAGNTVRGTSSTACYQAGVVTEPSLRVGLCRGATTNAPVLGATLVAASPACPALGHLDQGAPLCGDAHAIVASRAGDLVKVAPLCMRAMTGDGGGTLYYTQEDLGCEPNGFGGSNCRYAPTFHATGKAAFPGRWVFEAYTHIRHVNGAGGIGAVVAGSERRVECTFTGEPPGSLGCGGSAPNVEITAGNMNSFYWEGSYALTYIDAVGIEHLQSVGSAGGYLAQYFQ
jgi:hypothetical protein